MVSARKRSTGRTKNDTADGPGGVRVRRALAGAGLLSLLGLAAFGGSAGKAAGGGIAARTPALALPAASNRSTALASRNYVARQRPPQPPQPLVLGPSISKSTQLALPMQRNAGNSLRKSHTPQQYIELVAAVAAVAALGASALAALRSRKKTDRALNISNLFAAGDALDAEAKRVRRRRSNGGAPAGVERKVRKVIDSLVDVEAALSWADPNTNNRRDLEEKLEALVDKSLAVGFDFDALSENVQWELLARQMGEPMAFRQKKNSPNSRVLTPTKAKSPNLTFGALAEVKKTPDTFVAKACDVGISAFRKRMLGRTAHNGHAIRFDTVLSRNSRSLKMTITRGSKGEVLFETVIDFALNTRARTSLAKGSPPAWVDGIVRCLERRLSEGAARAQTRL